MMFGRKKILVVIIIAVMAAAFIYVYQSGARSRVDAQSGAGRSGLVHQVVLTEDGFTPKELRVRPGDTVRFATQRASSFWPASDLHPTHELYPEFDPKQPIQQGATWDFVFTKAGSWKYHDHLFPLYRGTIIVSGDPVSSVKAEYCGPDQKDASCWERSVAAIARAQGVAAAFDEVARLYETEPSFASGCHAYGHKIGEVAYEQFSRGEMPEFTQKASYCGYGYYHGFMEALLHNSGDVEQARAFCRGAVAQIQKGLGSQIEAACYHGMGHGAVDEGSLKELGSADRFIEPGFKLCEAVAGTFEHKKICGSGVYNSLALAWMRDQSSTVIDRDNPFAVCAHVQKDYFRIACLHQMNTVVALVTEANFPKAVKLVEKLTDDTDAVAAMDGIATQFGAGEERKKVQSSVIASTCTGTQARLQAACIRAYVGGLIEGGKPNEEEVQAVAFCKEQKLSSSLRAECYAALVSSLYAWLSHDRATEICMSLPADVEARCRQS